MTPDPDLCISRISDALSGAAFQYADPSIFLYPFSDFLLLWHQRPSHISIWQEEDDIPVFTTLADCDTNWVDEQPQAPWRGGRSNHTATLQADGRKFYISILPMFKRIPLDERILGAPQEGRLQTLLDQEGVAETLIPAVLHAARNRSAVSPVELSETLPENWMDILKYFQQRLNDCFIRLEKSTLLGASTNLWCVVRHKTVNGLPRIIGKEAHQFGYTASILPRPEQEKLILDVWDQHAKLRDEVGKYWDLATYSPIDVFRTPIGSANRAIADSAFGSGCIDFSLHAERSGKQSRDRGEGRIDKVRGEFEDSVYEAVRKRIGKRRPSSNSAFDRRPGIFYVPIHVAGTPWLALYSFWNEDDWNRRYWLYRDAIPDVAGQLRSAAREAYLECVATVLKKVLSKEAPQQAMEGILRTSLDDIARVYPFKQVRFQRTELTSEGPSWRYWTVDGTTWRICFDENRYFSHQFSMFDIDEEGMAKSIRQILDSTQALKLSGRIDGMYASAHAGRNLIVQIDAGGVNSFFGDAPHPTRLKYALYKIDRDGTVSDQRAEKEESILVGDLQRIYETQALAAASLSLSELLATSGALVDKFQNEKEYRLKQVLGATERFLKTRYSGEREQHREGRNNSGVFVLLQPDLSEATTGDIVFPPGYMDEQFLMVLLFELLNNAVKHSDSKAYEVPVRWGIENSKEGPLVWLRSPVTGSKEDWRAYNGFAVRAQDIQHSSALRKVNESFLNRVRNAQNRIGLDLSSTISEADGVGLEYRVQLAFHILWAKAQGGEIEVHPQYIPPE